MKSVKPPIHAGLASIVKDISTLYVFISLGIIGILVDADHLIVLVVKDIPITLANLNTQAGRPLHLPFLFFVWGMCICYGTYYYRLLKRGEMWKRSSLPSARLLQKLNPFDSEL